MTRRLASGHTHAPDCAYGRPTDVPHMSLVRMHAHVTDDGRLYALRPCFGWELLGRFVDDEHLETQLFARLRRLQTGDDDGLEGSTWPEARVAELSRAARRTRRRGGRFRRFRRQRGERVRGARMRPDDAPRRARMAPSAKPSVAERLRALPVRECPYTPFR